MKKVIFLFTLILATVINSCQDKIEQVAIENNSNVELIAKSGILSFNSQADFDAAVNIINEGGRLSYPRNFKSLSSYIASREVNIASKSTVEEDEYGIDIDDDEDELISSDVFMQLVNQNREVMVNDIIYRVTEYGTFFAPASLYEDLLECVNNFNGKNYIASDTEWIYSNVTYPGVNIYYSFHNPTLPPAPPAWNAETGPPWWYDTVFTYDSGGGSGGTTYNWKTVDDGKTWVGKFLSNIWGFSKVEHNYFSNYKRTRVKFYSLDFLVYAEAGVKTKYQTKYAGVWSKEISPQLVSGFEYLVFEEVWSKNIFPDTFDPAEHNLQATNVGSHGSYIFLGSGDTNFRQAANGNIKKTLFTVDIMGYELDFTSNTVQNLIYNSLKQAGRFGNRNKSEVAVRVLSKNNNKKSYIIAFDQHQIETYEDKNTFIIASHFGFVVTYSTNLNGGGFEWKNFKVEDAVPDLKYKAGTILYGSSKYSNSVHGVKMKFD